MYFYDDSRVDGNQQLDTVAYAHSSLTLSPKQEGSEGDDERFMERGILPKNLLKKQQSVPTHKKPEST